MKAGTFEVADDTETDGDARAVEVRSYDTNTGGTVFLTQRGVDCCGEPMVDVILLSGKQTKELRDLLNKVLGDA